MIVTRIEPITKQKSEVEIDGQLAFVLYKGELSRYKIKLNHPIEEEVYHEIIHVVLVKRAKLRAMHLLQRMDRTEKDLRVRLGRNGYPLSAIDEAIDYVKSYGYINDREYARRYIEYQKAGKGKQRLLSELYQKGIAKEIALEELEQADLGDQKVLIREQLRKKRKNKEEMDEKETRRIFAFLARKGFATNDIWSVLKEEGSCEKEIEF